MRVASNKLKDVLSFFHTELHDLYAPSEIEALIDVVAEHYLGFSKTERLLNENENINQSDLIKIYDCAKALKKNIPIQYVLGEAWFYNLRFKVNPHVLIPRPETEELVDLVIKENKGLLSALDLGTGSGCIPITIKHHLPAAAVFACDISKDALSVARQNALRNNAEVTFFEGDILHLESIQQHVPHKAEVIVSNPPYIKASEKAGMEKHVLEQEPHLALFVEGEDPIIFYKKGIDLCRHTLASKGKLYFELNPLTATSVKDYAETSKLFESVTLIKDMSGNMRFLKAVKF